MADPDFGTGNGPIISGIEFHPLKRLVGTGQEAVQINGKLIAATLLLQGKATKNAIKNIVRPSLLHLATHGYFLSNEPNNSSETEQRLIVRKKVNIATADIVNEPLITENPLLRSGLFFAKANTNSNEAILTSLEAASLDLWGTKLAVLSACDTGVGEVKNGDGVYGLRRALVLAGSESQIISLWSVSDTGTKDLMVAYYELLRKGAGRSSGLRRARLSFLANPKRQHPYYWASFIQSGEWANLVGKR
jgi:CHAT domain-containing protein